MLPCNIKYHEYNIIQKYMLVVRYPIRLKQEVLSLQVVPYVFHVPYMFHVLRIEKFCLIIILLCTTLVILVITCTKLFCSICAHCLSLLLKEEKKIFKRAIIKTTVENFKIILDCVFFIILTHLIFFEVSACS